MKTPEKNWLEWLVFGVSLVLVLATVGYLIREAVTADASPPDVVVALGQPARGSSGFMVPVFTTNRGGRPAADVQVTVTLETRDGSSQESVLVIPFLPRQSKRQGWVTFRADPRSGELEVSGLAFQSP